MIINEYGNTKMACQKVDNIRIDDGRKDMAHGV